MRLALPRIGIGLLAAVSCEGSVGDAVDDASAVADTGTLDSGADAEPLVDARAGRDAEVDPDPEPDHGNYRPQIQGEYAEITGGRGGQVLRVTSLADDGSEGTLRWAVAQSDAFVVFEVAGYVELTSALPITGRNLTIAGQTAPAPGITLKDFGIDVGDYGRTSGAENIVLQHIAIRPGWRGDNCNSGAIVYAPRVLFDHVSMSWQQDEGISPFVVDDVLIWRSIVAEALWGADVEGEVTCTGGGADIGHGVLVYSRSHHIAMIQNLLASNASRNPLLIGDTHTIVANNVVYNWKAPWAIAFQNQISGVPGDTVQDAWSCSAVGNRLIPNAGIAAYGGDPAGLRTTFFFDADLGEGGGANQLYDVDNTMEANEFSEPFAQDWNELGYDPRVDAPPEQALLTNVEVVSSLDVEALVTAHAGARPAARDEVDARVVDDVLNRNLPSTEPYVFDESDVGGFPPLKPATRAWQDAVDPDAVAPGQTLRTNREMKLEAEARALEP